MATQNVNIGINVSDNGTAKKVVKNFQEITQAATQAQQASKGINAAPVKSAPAPGGTSGSRRAAQPTGSQGIMDNESYGSARGTAGLTGASARDFANQAQGLGGLVRLYATLAANIFAASAAYTALSNAADTTNLVKGLDMLGAASGRNLGTLSKRLVEVTDGAVSMRDAMTATAQASSAGMTNKNIERLAQVAKNASLALGVAMPDALSRLSRGIVKLEPELLDELGLFTKIGPATERYALEIGKSVGALTDFERRQAFANAVLEEGEKKFGALSEAASNPYDKLLATLKNVIQSGLELVNKVLTPIVSLLAESPTALGAVIAGLGVLLLKQALPAIGQMRAGLRNTAEEALKTAEAFKESFGDEFQTRLEQRFKIPDLQAGLKKAEADLAKLNVPANIAGSVTKLAAGDLTSLKNVEKVLEKKNLTAEKGMRGSKQASEAQIAQAKQEVAYINAVIAVLKQKQALEAADTGALNLASKAQGRTDPEVIALQKYDKLRSKVDQANAISNAAQNAQIMGIRGSWALLNKEVADKGITGFTKYSTLAQGGLAAVGSRVMGLIGAFGNIGMAVGAAVAAFQLFDGFMSKNAKQTENFNKALTTANDSVSNVTRTLSAATSTEGFATRTIDNTAAFSNALNELTSSASEVIKLSREADRAAGTWDNFWDSVFSVVDKDRASKLAKTVADQIKSSIRLLQREGLADEYNAEIKKILNVDSLEDTEKVAEAFKNLTKTQQDAILLLQNNANRALGNISSNLQSFKTSTEAALRAQKTLANSFIDSSPMFLYGQNLISVSQGLTKIINAGPDRVVQALQEVATNTEKMGLFGETFVKSFAGISNLFLQQAKNIEASRNALVDYQRTLEQVSKPPKTANLPFGSINVGVQANDTRERAGIANSDVREIQRAINAQQDGVVRDVVKLAKDAAKATYEEGLLYINKAIREAQNAAAITIGRALTVNLTGVQKIEADNQLRQQEIEYQLASIDVSEKVLDVQASLVDEMRLANALQVEANTLLKNSGKTDPASKDQNTEATRQVNMARAAAGQGTAGLSAIDVAQIESDRRDARDLRRKGTQAQRIALGAQSNASTIGVAAQRPGAELAQAEELAKITDRTNASLLSRSQILNSITGITSTELTKAKQATEITQLENKQKRELDEIQARITAATDLKLIAEKQNNEEGRIAARGQQRQIDQLNKVKEATKAAQAADLSLISAKSRQELLSDEIALIGRRAELERSGAELQNTLAQARLDTTSQEFALYSSAFEFSRKFVINQQSSLDIQRAQLETTRAIAQAEAALEQKRLEAVAKINELGDDEEADQRAKEIGGELARQRTITADTVAGLKAQGDAKLNILQKTREVSLEQERYNVLLDNSRHLATSLGAVFGDMGSKIGGLTSAMTEFAVASEKNAKSLLKLEDDRKKAIIANDPKAQLEIDEEIATQRTKNTRTELSGNAKLAGSAKSLFKEKTGAYKVFAAVERGFQVASLALEIKTSLTKLGLWKAEVPAKVAAEAGVTAAGAAGAAARAPLTFGEIVGNYLSKIPPPFGMIAGLAAGAYFLSLLGKSGGGGGGGGAFVPNAQQRQETQGTAMDWDSEGQKVQVRRGVFGDTDAKSESIANSLEIMKENTIEGLYYDNRAVNLLESINKGISGAAKNLFNVRGLRSGSMFNTIEGSQGGRGFLGTGLFGSKTSRNITDSGLIIEGTFAQLASDTNKAVIDFFEQVTVTRKRTFGRTKSWVEINRKEIDNETSQFFQDVFGNATELFKVYAEKTGDITTQQVDQILGDLKIDNAKFVSLRGLKGKEFETELSAVIGSVLDDAALAIFGSFEKFSEFGEGMLETVSRVIDTNDKVSAALKAMGSSFDLSGAVGTVLMEVRDNDSISSKLKGFFGLRTKTILQEMDVAAANALRKEYLAADRAQLAKLQSIDVESGYDGLAEQKSELEASIKQLSVPIVDTLKYEISEALVSLAGGLEEFTSRTNFFIQNFLSESQQLDLYRETVTQTLRDLELPTDLTREQYTALVQAQDKNTDAGRRTFDGLMKLAPAFDKVASRAESFSEPIRDLEIELLRASGNTEAYNTAIRKLETEGFTPAEIAAYDLRKALEAQVAEADRARNSLDNLGKQNSNLSVELLRASGNTEAYNTAIRKLETEGFTPAEIAAYDLGKSLQAQVSEADRARNSLDSLAQESLMLSANLLKAQGDMEGYSAAIAAIETKDMKTAQELAAYNNNQSLKRQIESTEAANRAREEAAQEAKRAAEKAAADAQQVADQKLSLEQRIYSIQGNTNKLRELELRNVDSSNQALQSYVWALEDYTNILRETEDTIKGLREKATDEYLSASDKVLDAQKAIADLAIEAAKKMRDFGSSLREFVNEQLMPESSANVTRLFTQTVQGALSGDEQALDSVRDIATQAIEAAKASARTSVEFNKARSTILASVSDVAAYAEAQSALIEIPEEDPLVLANKTLEEALKEQTNALYVANTIGASLVKAQEDLVALYFAAQSRVPSVPIAPFANGGIFDNDIIRRPTYFNLGLMGEAGAEAIMPLTRTRDGSLGVVATSEPNTNLGRAIGTQNAALVEQVKLLREEVSLLRYEARATAVSTTKTTRILERVTQNGESLLVTDTATL